MGTSPSGQAESAVLASPERGARVKKKQQARHPRVTRAIFGWHRKYSVAVPGQPAISYSENERNLHSNQVKHFQQTWPLIENLRPHIGRISSCADCDAQGTGIHSGS